MHRHAQIAASHGGAGLSARARATRPISHADDAVDPTSPGPAQCTNESEVRCKKETRCYVNGRQTADDGCVGICTARLCDTFTGSSSPSLLPSPRRLRLQLLRLLLELVDLVNLVDDRVADERLADVAPFAVIALVHRAVRRRPRGAARPSLGRALDGGSGGGVVVVVSGVNGVYNAVEESRMVVAPTESASAGRSNSSSSSSRLSKSRCSCSSIRSAAASASSRALALRSDSRYASSWVKPYTRRSETGQ